MKTIHSPEGVSLLMENLWLRHKAGIKQHEQYYLNYLMLKKKVRKSYQLKCGNNGVK